jgi:hypothetical protein
MFYFEMAGVSNRVVFAIQYLCAFEVLRDAYEFFSRSPPRIVEIIQTL